MALATDDVQQINGMINPGILFISDILLGFGIPIIVIALDQPASFCSCR